MRRYTKQPVTVNAAFNHPPLADAEALRTASGCQCLIDRWEVAQRNGTPHI